MNLSPIVLFVYNRPWHTEQTLNALKQNSLAEQSSLYILCDGPKKNASKEELNSIKETREIIKQQQWCKEVIIEEKQENWGLAKSIIDGVTRIVNKHGKIIVLEDDIVTSIGFLKYMNDALNLYKEEEKVMHISGYMYPNKDNLPETFFFNVPLCWGWATWQRAWSNFNEDGVNLWKTIASDKDWNTFNKFGGDYLQFQLAFNIVGKMKTWFIKWHASLFLLDAFSLFPQQSLVKNIGFDRSGEHSEENDAYKVDMTEFINVSNVTLIENELAKKIICDFYKKTYYTSNKSSVFSYLLKKSYYKGKLKTAIKNFIIKILNSEFVINKKLESSNSYYGNHVKIYPTSTINNSLISNYTYIAHNAFIMNTVIGKFCSIGPNLICGRGIHPVRGITTSPMFYSTMKQNGITLCSENKIKEFKTTVIGNDVFIGANVTILDGVTIGDGAVIGAGAIVSKDIPAYAIAVGNPIEIKEYRFNNDIIHKLLKIKWWNKDEVILQNIEKYFTDIDAFIAQIESINEIKK